MKFKIGDVVIYKSKASYKERILDIVQDYDGSMTYLCDIPDDEFAARMKHDKKYLEYFFYKPNKFFNWLYGKNK